MVGVGPSGTDAKEFALRTAKVWAAARANVWYGLVTRTGDRPTFQRWHGSDADGMVLIGRLFAEDDVRVFEPKPVVFRCRCSRRRAEEVLRMLGEAETREVLAERGQLDVTCEYCGRRREFDPVDISGLFADNAVTGPESLQ